MQMQTHTHSHTRAHGRHNKLISRAEVSEHKFPRGNIINKTNTFKWPESLRAPSSAPDITRVQVTSHKKNDNNNKIRLKTMVRVRLFYKSICVSFTAVYLL